MNLTKEKKKEHNRVGKLLMIPKKNETKKKILNVFLFVSSLIEIISAENFFFEFQI